MAAEHHAQRRGRGLGAEHFQSPGVETDAAPASADQDRPSLDLSVSASAKDGTALLSLVNAFPDQDLEMQCTLEGATVKEATALLLHDADWNASNSFDAPDRVVPKPVRVKVEASAIRLDLPRMSVATLTLTP